MYEDFSNTQMKKVLIPHFQIMASEGLDISLQAQSQQL